MSGRLVAARETLPEVQLMALTVAATTFDNVRYDADADVLYLHVGEPSTAVTFDVTPEGHALRFDDAGRLVV